MMTDATDNKLTQSMMGSVAIAKQLQRIADSLERYEVHAGIFLHSLTKDQEAHIVLNRIISQLSVTKRLLEHINESK